MLVCRTTSESNSLSNSKVKIRGGVVRFREPEVFSYFNTSDDSLISTEQSGFYVSKVPLEIRKIFRKNRIKGLLLRKSDRENRIKKLIEDLKNDSTEDKEDPVFNSIQQNAVIFSEQFEGYFRGRQTSSLINIKKANSL